MTLKPPTAPTEDLLTLSAIEDLIPFVNVKAPVGVYSGATGDGVTDDQAVVQAHVDALTSAGGGALYFPTSEYIIGSQITLPVDTPITFFGDGMGFVGNSKVTRLKRKAGTTDEILNGTGTGIGSTQRIHFQMNNMQLHGNSESAPIFRLSRANECLIDRCRFSNSGQEAVVSTQLWNCEFRSSYFSNSGNGTTNAVVRLDAPAGEESANTVHFIGCEWESNTGTDLKVTGTVDWGLAVQLTNCKMERNVGSYPLINLDQAGGFSCSDTFLHLGASATASLIEQKGTSASPVRSNNFSNCTLSHTGTPTYFVDQTVGVMGFSNCSLNGTPATAYFHAGSALGLRDQKLSNILGAYTRSLLLHDQRTGSTYGYGRVMVPATLVGVAATDSVDQGVYLLPDAATTDYEGQATLPSDAAIARPIRVRVWWYSAAVAGDARIRVNTAVSLADGDSIAGASTSLTSTATTPGVANVLKVTTFQGTDNCDPGEIIRCKVSRLGADGADTLVTQMRLYAVEILYEREL